MALREKTIVEQRFEAMALLAKGWPVAEVAARFEVSRQAACGDQEVVGVN